MNTIPFYQQFETRPCAVCNSMTSNHLFRQMFSEMSDWSLLHGYDVVVCEICGFGFADHVPPQSDFDAYYRDMSKYEYQNHGGRETIYDLNRFKAIVNCIEPFLPDSNVRILDIGCATGKLLGLFKEKGYGNVTGIDPSPICSRTAQELYGVNTKTGTFFEISDIMASEPLFDFVILTGVLEHIMDIHQALLNIRRIVTERGMIFIEVPDATEFARWPDAPFQEFSTEHINFFSRTSLDNLMRRYGFGQVISQQAAREQSFGAIMPVITAIYRLENSLQPGICVKDTETVLGLREYIRISQDVENRIKLTIDGLVKSAVPIVVWGVGTHTQHLLTTSRLSQTNIRAFVDSNPRYQGKQLNGISILSPKELWNRTEAILISSMVFQHAIEEQIRNELQLNNDIIKLYDV